MAGLQDLQDRV